MANLQNFNNNNFEMGGSSLFAECLPLVKGRGPCLGPLLIIVSVKVPLFEKTKIKLDVLRIFDGSLKISYFQKSFLNASAIFLTINQN